jgi:hypothetical protein
MRSLSPSAQETGENSQIEEIVDIRTFGDDTEYLVKFVGGRYRDCVWVPQETVKSTPAGLFALQRFLPQSQSFTVKDVEGIVAYRETNSGSLKALVKWKNYGLEKSTWESSDSVPDGDFLPGFGPAVLASLQYRPPSDIVYARALQARMIGLQHCILKARKPFL